MTNREKRALKKRVKECIERVLAFTAIVYVGVCTIYCTMALVEFGTNWLSNILSSIF